LKVKIGGNMKPAIKFEWPLSLLALILAALACNWSEIAPPPAPVIEPSPLPTFAISTLTPVPTETPLPTPTSTPDAPVAWPKNQGINCRYGPGQEWEVVNTIPTGTIAEIKGRVVDTSWWYVSDPMTIDESFCWVAYDVVDTAGNLNIVPIVEPPVASVTDVTVDTAVVTFTACGGSNQVMFNGSITANGPETITYRWEVSGAAQETTPDATLKFSLSGTQNVTAAIDLIECGEYSATLRVIEPNELFAQKAFDIQSP
jgi:uncharacterized protein YraI